MATYHLTAKQFLEIVQQEVECYISSDGDNTPPTGGTIVVEIERDGPSLKISSFHNLVEHMVDLVTNEANGFRKVEK
jgi:hypothetical protein